MDQETRKKIWVFCFEYAGIAKVGGLGEVSSNQSRNLVHEQELELEVFMPSHGRHLTHKEKLGLTPLTEPDGKKLVIRGHFDPSYFGMTMVSEIHKYSATKFSSIPDPGYFEVEIWRGFLDDVPINLLVGINPIANQILNDTEVYGSETLNAKLGLFSWVMKEFMRYCIYKEPSRIPDVIHIHDHHPVTALMCCRQELNKVGRDVRSIITMHLLTWPRRDLDFFWKAGVNNEPMLIQLGDHYEWKRMREIYEICKGKDTFPPTLEKIGCVISDKVIAVSHNFLHSDIIPNCGGDLIRWKSDFTWNGCDWDYEANRQTVWKKHGKWYEGKKLEEMHSWDFREKFLTEILGNLPKGEPRITNEIIKEVIQKEFQSPPYRPDCRVDAFDEDGPLVLVTGRVSPQKGIENIFYTFPYVIEKIPNVKFLFLMVPTPYTLDDLRYYMSVARKYPRNVRFIFGIAGSIYLLAHLSADVYTCPSRWEPFGIVALEAMASKIPVVATYVGGLMESILHLEDFPETGTGLLCPNNDGEALKYALVSLLSTMQITEKKHKNPSLTKEDVKDLIDNIVHPNLRAQVEKDLLFGDKIRENALRRVETTFRWKKVSQKLKEIYLEVANRNVPQ